jgi:PPP family 3-phenylpropionic acid transporter
VGNGKSGGNPYAYVLPAFISVYMVFAVISPYLPLLVRGLGYRPATVGILLGLVEAAGIVGPFALGQITDRWGIYKPGLITAVLLMLLPGLPLAYTANPLLSGLLLCALAVGYRSSVPLMDAMTTILVGKEGNYGKVRALGSVGFIAVVLFLQYFPLLPRNSSLNIAFWLTVFAFTAFVFMLILPARYTALRRQEAEVPARGHIGSGKKPYGTKPFAPKSRRIRTPLFTLGLVMIALSRIAMSPVYSFFSLYLVEYVRWDAVGFLWAVAALAETPMMYFSHRIIRRFKSPLTVIMISGSAVSLRLLIYALFPSRPAMIAAQLMHSLCYGLFHPAAIAFITASIPPERRALGMTLYLSLGTGLPTFLGNILGGFVVEYLGYRALFASYAVFPVLALAVYLVIRRGAGGNTANFRLPES